MKVEKCSTAPMVATDTSISYDEAMKKEGIYRQTVMGGGRLVVLRIGEHVTSFWYSEYSGIEPCISIKADRFFVTQERLCMEIRK